MLNKLMKRCSTSYVSREMQNKTAMRCYYTSIGMSKIQNTESTKCSCRCGAKGILIHCWWECKIVQPLWKTV